MNRVILYGNLGGDVEKRTTNGGKSVANFTIATSNGRDKPPTWHKVVVWEQGADIAADRGVKGAKALVDGRLEYRQWEDREGNQRTVAEVVAFRVEWPTRPSSEAPPAQRDEPPPPDDEDEESLGF